MFSAQIFLDCFLLTAPSELHAVDRLGREVVVTTGSAHSGERLTLKGQAESAGRKQPFNRAQM